MPETTQRLERYSGSPSRSPTRRGPRQLIRLSLSLLLGASLSACGALLGEPESAPASPDEAQTAAEERDFASNGRVIVIEGEDLRRGGLLIDVLSQRVANMQVLDDGELCPTVHLRGSKTLHGASSPQVYLDGARATNTCVLTTVRADDVDRIEVYPSGVTSRPGYRNHPSGLVLVFTRSA